MVSRATCSEKLRCRVVFHAVRLLIDRFSARVRQVRMSSTTSTTYTLILLSKLFAINRSIAHIHPLTDLRPPSEPEL